jgi:hypothetical protein
VGGGDGPHDGETEAGAALVGREPVLEDLLVTSAGMPGPSSAT